MDLVARSICTLFLVASAPVGAGVLTFSTGNPDGLVATASRIPQPGILGIESADDFALAVLSKSNMQRLQACLWGAAQLTIQGRQHRSLPRISGRLGHDTNTKRQHKEFSRGYGVWMGLVLRRATHFFYQNSSPSFTEKQCHQRHLRRSESAQLVGEGAVTGVLSTWARA